jgi:hypothetical protein
MRYRESTGLHHHTDQVEAAALAAYLSAELADAFAAIEARYTARGWEVHCWRTDYDYRWRLEPSARYYPDPQLTPEDLIELRLLDGWSADKIVRAMRGTGVTVELVARLRRELIGRVKAWQRERRKTIDAPAYPV